MDESHETRDGIPSDYSCRMVFRQFQKTMMHEHGHFLRRDRVFFWDSGNGVSWRHYCGPNACLEHYLRMGWPEAARGARWFHDKKVVEVFIDEMFLCHQCGTFTLNENGASNLEGSDITFEGELIVMPNGKGMEGVTVECANQIRRYCESRINCKEFYLKQCENQKVCEEVRAIAIRRLRRERRAHKSDVRPMFPEPVTEVPANRPPEKIPWDEGYVYLVRCGEFHKIGLARDADKRLSGLKTSSPFEMELLKKWRCKRPDVIEALLHERFKEFRTRGEWFKLSPDLVQSLLDLRDLNAEFPGEAD